MPSPFNNKEGAVSNEAVPSKSKTITVHGELFCEWCFQVSGEGIYHPQAKRLSWDCVSCGRTNAVRNFEYDYE